MSPSMWPLQSKCEVFDSFQEILQGPQCWSFESRLLSTKRTQNYKCGVKIWAMCAQLGLEVMCKRPQKKRRPSNFHWFQSKEVHSRKHPKKKNFDVWML
jgi:hypothetical protein